MEFYTHNERRFQGDDMPHRKQFVIGYAIRFEKINWNLIEIHTDDNIYNKYNAETK